MTMPEPAPARKPARRFWLYAPYFVVLFAFVGWSAIWLTIRATVAAQMTQAAATAESKGFTAHWSHLRIDGYPFRIEVTVDQPRLGEPSGWGLAAPQVKAIANAYELNHWVVVASNGVTLTRPYAGATAITGDALRASYVGQTEGPARIVIEGLNVRFAAAPGAKPFPLARAARAALYTRPGPADRMEARAVLDDAWATPGTRFSEAVGQASIAMIWQGVFTRVSAFHGADAPAATRAWAAAGGTITPVVGGLGAGPRSLGLYGSGLTLDPDGRLKGTLSVVLRGGGDAIRALGADHTFDPFAAIVAGGLVDLAADKDGKARVNLTFQDGQTRLGPVTIAPSPRPF